MRSVKRLGMTTDWSRSECGCLVVRFDIISMLYLDSCLITGLYFACCIVLGICIFFFFSSRRRHTRSLCDWSSDVCSSDLQILGLQQRHREFELEADDFAVTLLKTQDLSAEPLYDFFLRMLEEEHKQRRADRSEERRVGKECRSQRST